MNEKLIFFVDDEPMFINLLEYTFSCRSGYSVRTFQSGEKCIENMHLKPDLVVVDFYLNSGDLQLTGMDVAKKIKEINPATIVAFLSGNDDQSVIDEARSVGVDKYVLKDGFFIDNLVTYITNLFPAS